MRALRIITPTINGSDESYCPKCRTMVPWKDVALHVCNPNARNQPDARLLEVVRLMNQWSLEGETDETIRTVMFKAWQLTEKA